MEQRIAWDDLPGPLKDAIQARTGPIITGRAVADSQNSPLAAVVQSAGGKTFVQGTAHGPPAGQDPEPRSGGSIAGHGISPELLWQFDEEGWNVLGFPTSRVAQRTTVPGLPTWN